MKEENDTKASESKDNNESGSRGREEVYTRIIRAGNRTYFLDVKATRKNDLYLTITESKKRFNKEGKFFYEKHKLFLYPEDFDKFTDGMEDVISFIKNSDQHSVADSVQETDEKPETEEKKEEADKESKSTDEFINVEFEDLGDK